MDDSGQLTTPSSKRSDIAGRHTPLIRNQWYIAALSEEVTRKPLQRTLLEQDIVLYRKEDGSAVALQNRCAHRSYPLHQGRLDGDRIVCGYHGFEYGPDGRCALAPALGMKVDAIRIQTYPVKEIGPFLWIWTGDPENVDYDKLIEQPWFTEDGWRYKAGYFYMKANYLGMHENLMDLSHFPFLHTFAKGQVALALRRAEVETHPDRILSTLEMHDFPVPPVARKAMGFQGPVTQLSRGVAKTPAMNYGDIIQTDCSSPPKVAAKYIVHSTTPESQERTHYYWAVSRDFGLENEELDREIVDFAVKAFMEDVVALEAIEDIIRRDNRPDFRERIVASDKGGIQLMRLFAQMAQEEASEGRELNSVGQFASAIAR